MYIILAQSVHLRKILWRHFLLVYIILVELLWHLACTLAPTKKYALFVIVIVTTFPACVYNSSGNTLAFGLHPCTPCTFAPIISPLPNSAIADKRATRSIKGNARTMIMSIRPNMKNERALLARSMLEAAHLSDQWVSLDKICEVRDFALQHYEAFLWCCQEHSCLRKKRF